MCFSQEIGDTRTKCKFVFQQHCRCPTNQLEAIKFSKPIVMVIHWLDFALLLFDTFMLSSTSVLGLPVFIGLLLAFSVVPVLHKWFHAIIFRAYKKTKQQQQKSASFIANSSSRAEESRVGP
ncbi:hypothetical protein niasHT_019359 [Heterodera trifolii]|uniref:Uncharacterized protein n=1 Tax=Heterodera trifolii TaxID=157864 RepID=A0ABD2L5J1_9BILA